MRAIRFYAAWRLLRSRGQVTLEYFILFAVIGLVTLIGLSRLDDDVRTSLTGMFSAVVSPMGD